MESSSTEVPLRGYLWALLSAVSAGLFVIPWKLSNTAGPAPVSVLVMLSVAALSSTLLSLLQLDRMDSAGSQAHDRRLTGLSQWVLSGTLAASTLIGNYCSARSVALLSPAAWSLLQRTEVLWVAALAFFLVRERIDRRFLLGVVIAGAGLWLMQRGGPRGEGGVSPAGAAYAIAAAGFFSVIAVLVRKYSRRVDLLQLNAQRLWLSVGLWFLVSGAPRSVLSASATQIGYGALAGLLGPVLSRLALMFSSRHIEARLTALVAQLSPVFAALFSSLLLGEDPGGGELAGGSLMLFGVIVSLFRPTAPVRRP